MKTSDFDYDLPSERIAQHPTPRRDGSRLLLLERATRKISHHSFTELPDLLQPDDLLVLNDAKVIPARLLGKKIPGGGKVELLLAEELSLNRWRALAHARGKIKAGTDIEIISPVIPPIRATFIATDQNGVFTVEFSAVENIAAILDQIGLVPLPPYIDRITTLAQARQRYQTIYAQSPGAIAAPTAGLHFTTETFRELQRRNIEYTFLTLHVGLGTFRPVKTDRIADHFMNAEKFYIPPTVAQAIGRAKREHRRIVAVGTTVVRALESAAITDSVRTGHNQTSLFIHPPYSFQIVDALLTNFHLPRSTLLMLVSAFASPGEQTGRDFVLSAYRAAIAQRYRFYSYGDCMLIV